MNSPIRRGGSAQLLRNGDAFLPAMIQALDESQRSINWTTYIWSDGRMSDRILAAMHRALDRGVEIRILLDHFGSLGSPTAHLDELKRRGAEIAVFRPPDLGHLARYHRRNHRRAVVVDGHAGFIGGAAVMDEWLGNAQDETRWRDDMVRVDGPLARSLQSAFAQLWTATTGEILTGESHWPEDPPTTGEGDLITYHLSVVSSPSSGNYPIRTVHWMSVASATERLWITNPYFVPDQDLRDVLRERARAGVDVRLLTAGDNTDVGLVRWASHRCYEELLEAGVRIYEYQPTMIHQKALVADGVWSVVGSANLDIRSEELNEENLLAIADGGFAEALAKSFELDLEEAKEISLDAWRARPFWYPVRERLAALIQEQL
ncbi:MAG: hypothetical protein HKP27_11105 [Myxococcales bacterium]|nr:hypothetical protein [Myxococcales bacterium]